jgi:hypothetical protein
MCFKCEAKKAALAAFGMEQVEEKVGTIGRGFIKELAQLQTAYDKLQDQIKVEEERLAKYYVSLVDEQINKKFGKKVDDLIKLQEKVLLDAFITAGIDPSIAKGYKFHINRATGEVFTVHVKKKGEDRVVH